MPENQEPARRLGQDDPLRGEFTDGKALTDEEIKRAGISREGTLGSIGYRIGRNAGETVISNLRNGTIDERQALWIADFAPGSDKVQAAGVRLAIEGGSKGEILARMEAEQALQNMSNEMGLSGGTDLFGGALDNDEFNNFAAKYVNRRRNGLGQDISYLNKLVGKKLSKEQAKKFGIDIKDPEGLRKALDKLKLEQAEWQNPWVRRELMDEIRDAWKKENPTISGSGDLTDGKGGKGGSDGTGGASMSVTAVKRGTKEPPVFKMLDLYHGRNSRGGKSAEGAGGGSFSVTEAKERGLFDKDGVLKAENAAVFAPGTSFSIIAYHVSPNDFDAFKTKFIGSGMGAQFFGHGIYFTDDAKMNKVYIRKVGKKTGKSPVNYRVELDMEQEDLLPLDGKLSPEMRERLRPLYEEMLAKLPEVEKRPDVEFWQEEYAFHSGGYFQDFLETCLRREGKGAKEVSLALLKHGVKGAKQKLDNGASYIVAFDENDIKITAKGYEATGYEWQEVPRKEEPGGGSFSVTEVKPVRDCVEELAAGRERGMLRNTAWGRDIAVPLGRAGKRGYGIEHIQEKRILHGLSPDDAAFVTVCALNAAQSVKTPETRGNKDLFDRFGVRAVVAKDDSTGHMVITGFVLNTKGGNRAVDSEAAQLAQHFYALDELSRIQQVGAALKRAVARFEDIVNKNPHDWENVVSCEVEMLKIKQNARQDGTYMKAPNGEKTNLSERQWAAVRTEAFKEWFGDWERDPENASKVVDENGEPMVVYHGTQRDFGNVFRDPEEDRDWRGQYDMNYAEDTYWFADHAFTAQTYQSPPRLKPDGNYVQTAKRPRNKTPLAAEDVDYTFYKRTIDRRGWPVDTPVSAEEALKKDGTIKEGRGRTSYYANMRLKPGRKTPQGYEGLNGLIMQFNATGFRGKVPRTPEEALDWWNRGMAEDEMPLPRESRLYEVFLNVRNPLIIDEHGEKFRDMGRKAYRAKNTGHDGLIAKDVRDPGSYETQISNGKSIAVFKPGQIKSATENRGTYSPRSADITFSVIGPRAKTFSKYVDKAFLGRDDGKMRAEIDSSQARLKGAWMRPEDADRLLGRMLKGDGQREALVELRGAWDRYRQLVHKRSRTKEEEAELRSLRARANAAEKKLSGLAGRVLDEMGYDTMEPGRLEKMRRAVLLGEVETLKKYDKYRVDGARKLGDILDYPELFDAYPELAEMEVKRGGLVNKGAWGEYRPDERSIALKEDLPPEKARSVLLHEIQHAIQDIEGFARGVSPLEIGQSREEVSRLRLRLEILKNLPKEAKRIDLSTQDGRKRLWDVRENLLQKRAELYREQERKQREERRSETIEEREETTALSRQMAACSTLYGLSTMARGKKNAREITDDLKKKLKETRARLRGVRQSLSDYEVYLRTPGEIESRNVQTRRDWTAEQRR